MNREVWALVLCVLTCGCLGGDEHGFGDESDRQWERRARVDDHEDSAEPREVETIDQRYVDCSTIKAGRLPTGISRLESFEGVTQLGARDHVLFGARIGVSQSEIWARTTPLGTAHVVAYLAVEPQVLAVDGDQLFFNSPNDGLPVGRVPLGGGTVLALARELLSPLALVVDGDRVFWLADSRDGSTDVAALLSSDRDPGNTRTLTTVSGLSVPGTLVHVGNALYFAAYTTVERVATQLYRFDLEGEQVVPLGQQDAIVALATDGETLFAGRVGMPDSLRNPTGTLGVARVGLEDGTLEPLFPQRTEPVRMLAVDATTLYWASDASTPNGQLWRGDNTGAGEAALVAAGWQSSTGLAQNADGVFWTVPCGKTHHVMRARK